MAATATSTQVTIGGVPSGATRSAAATIIRAILAVLAEGVRGDEFNRRCSTPSGAQFSMLPRRQQSKALDLGARPLH
jgi:hypothetical protein